MLKLLPMLGCAAVVLPSLLVWSAEPGSARDEKTSAVSQTARFWLEPIHWLKPSDGLHRLVTRDQLRVEKLEAQLGGVAFRAVCTNEWPAGLVPVFAVEKPGHFELRRLPPHGQENESQPLFFALPPGHEPDAAKIAGRWTCHATRDNGSEPYLVWELAVERDRLAGRFDQNAEYRFAYLAGGTFRSNTVALRVEYTMDVYNLVGEWRAGRLKGRWQHIDGSERGTWEAWREPAQLPPAAGTVALYEWRRASDDARRYALEGQSLEKEWERVAEPLCRVWPGLAAK